MSFCVRTTQHSIPIRIPENKTTLKNFQDQPVEPYRDLKIEKEEKDLRTVKMYTQEDMDIVDAKYNERFKKMMNILEDPANIMLDEYKKKLKSELSFEKQIVVYDKATKEWKLVDSSSNILEENRKEKEREKEKEENKEENKE